MLWKKNKKTHETVDFQNNFVFNGKLGSIFFDDLQYFRMQHRGLCQTDVLLF